MTFSFRWKDFPYGGNNFLTDAVSEVVGAQVGRIDPEGNGLPGENIPDVIGPHIQKRPDQPTVRGITHAEETSGPSSAKKIHENGFDLVVLMMGQANNVSGIFCQNFLKECITPFAEEVLRKTCGKRIGKRSDPERASDMTGEILKKTFVFIVFRTAGSMVEMQQCKPMTFPEETVKKKCQEKRVGPSGDRCMKVQGCRSDIRVNCVIPQESLKAGKIARKEVSGFSSLGEAGCHENSPSIAEGRSKLRRRVLPDRRRPGLPGEIRENPPG